MNKSFLSHKVDSMNKLSILIILFLFIVPFQTKAQNYFGMQFSYMQPLNDYEKNLEVSPKGFGLNYMFKPKVFKKIYIGAQFGVSMYATDSYTLSVEIEQNEFLDVEVEEEDCFLSYNLTGRYYFVENKLINPYIEGRIGGLSFFSTKMTDEDYDKYYDNSTAFFGTSFQKGIGGGFSYHVKDNLWMDFNVIYNSGTKTDYRNIGTSDIAFRVDPELSKFESYTDNLNFNLGIQFGF